jgi:hypothetical protein
MATLAQKLLQQMESGVLHLAYGAGLMPETVN